MFTALRSITALQIKQTPPPISLVPVSLQAACTHKRKLTPDELCLSRQDSFEMKFQQPGAPPKSTRHSRSGLCSALLQPHRWLQPQDAKLLCSFICKTSLGQ